MKKMKCLLAVCAVFFALGSRAQSGVHFTGNIGGSNISAMADHRELLIPSAFSPNGDGQNDVFKIATGLTTEKLIEFRVFNRWGTVLFRTTDAQAGWDGHFNGQQQPVGVYGYVIKIGYSDGYVETYKGTVTLVR
ncbi:MAG: gliding motility-associated C-terminal domain-containing protein [Edaphocola sp.]